MRKSAWDLPANFAILATAAASSIVALPARHGLTVYIGLFNMEYLTLAPYSKTPCAYTMSDSSLESFGAWGFRSFAAWSGLGRVGQSLGFRQVVLEDSQSLPASSNRFLASQLFETMSAQVANPQVATSMSKYTMRYYTILYYTILYYTIRHYAILQHTIL